MEESHVEETQKQDLKKAQLWPRKRSRIYGDRWTEATCAYNKCGDCGKWPQHHVHKYHILMENKK